MRTHELKTDPEVFEAVATGRKTFEIRKNDRNFQMGDLLNLRETKYTGAEMKPRHNGGYPGKTIEGKPLVYTGRQLVAEVTHILQGPIYGLIDGWAILSVMLLPTASTPPTYAQGQEGLVAAIKQAIERLEDIDSRDGGKLWWQAKDILGGDLFMILEGLKRALPTKEGE